QAHAISRDTLAASREQQREPLMLAERLPQLALDARRQGSICGRRAARIARRAISGQELQPSQSQPSSTSPRAGRPDALSRRALRSRPCEPARVLGARVRRRSADRPRQPPLARRRLNNYAALATRPEPGRAAEQR